MPEPIVRQLLDFLGAELKPSEMVLDPWLPENGLALISSPPGCGKTWLGLSCAIAIASGGSILGWKAPEPRRVLYIDGEMALSEMQLRCKQLIAGLKSEKERELARNNLFLYCDGDQPNGIRKLSSLAGRQEVEKILLKYDIDNVWVDNISTTSNDEDENEVASWTQMQDWQRRLRRQGYSGVWLHHTGKAIRLNEAGDVYYKQRGTSKREDILNTSMVLKPEGQHGFGVVFTKHRGFLPGDEQFVKIDVAEDGSTARLLPFQPHDEKKKEEQPKGKPNMKAIERNLDQ